MDELPPHISVESTDDWRGWLDENHTTASEVWLLYWKKGSGKPSIVWADAVEIALRYGWIDGIIRSIDEHRYMQRWTPRRPKSKWSNVNKQTALRLIAAGEMTPMGLATVEAAKASGEWDRAYTVQRSTPVPDDLKAKLKSNPDAKDQFRRVSRTRWERWVAWLNQAEGAARTRRLNMIVKALETRDYAPVDAKAVPAKATPSKRQPPKS
jgi:uncharacterized protein YdeI (YjbR/CyaY-like superfamily)